MRVFNSIVSHVDDFNAVFQKVKRPPFNSKTQILDGLHIATDAKKVDKISGEAQRLLQKYENVKIPFFGGMKVPVITESVEGLENVGKIIKNPKIEQALDLLQPQLGMGLMPSSVINYLDNKPEHIDDFIRLAKRQTNSYFSLDNAGIICDELAQNNKIIKRLLNVKDSKGAYLLDEESIVKIKNLSDSNSDIIHKLLDNKDSHFLLKAIEGDNIELLKNESLLEAILKNSSKTADITMINGNSNSFNVVQIINENGVNRKIINTYEIKDSKVKVFKDEIVENLANNTTAQKELRNGEMIEVSIDANRRIKTEEDAMNSYSQKVYPRIFTESKYSKKYYDVSGNVKMEKVIEEAEIPGQYNVTTYLGGKETPSDIIKNAEAKYYGTNNQGLKVERHFTSPNGIKSDYRVVEGPKGSALDYTISDAEGNVLTVLKRRSRQIGENHYTSTLNGQKYDIVFDGNKVKVSKLNNNNNDIIDTIELGEELLDPNLNDLYRKMPGDYFYTLKEANTKCELNKNYWNSIIHHNAQAVHYKDGKTEIKIDTMHGNNGFIFSHELGHIKDYKIYDDLRKSKDIKNQYMKEWRELHETSSLAESTLIDYFSPLGTMFSPVGGAGESIGEIEGLASGLLNNTFNGTGMRTILFQENFPELISDVINIFYKKA